MFASGEGESAPLRAPLVRHRSGQKSAFKSAAASSSLRLSEGQDIAGYFSCASVFITKISSNGNVSHNIKTTDSGRAKMSIRTQKTRLLGVGVVFHLVERLNKNNFCHYAKESRTSPSSKRTPKMKQFPSVLDLFHMSSCGRDRKKNSGNGRERMIRLPVMFNVVQF